jgi:hypothetical protein
MHLSDFYLRTPNTGGDKPRRYLLGRASSVVVGFIPARKSFNVDQIAQLGFALGLRSQFCKEGSLSHFFIK